MATRTNPQVDRYQLVKLRSNIRHCILNKKGGPYTVYGYMLSTGGIPYKNDGELLGIEGFTAQYRKVRKDIKHKFSDFTICFLYRCSVKRFPDSKPRSGLYGLRMLQQMTGLQEVTIKDILILNGEMR